MSSTLTREAIAERGVEYARFFHDTATQASSVKVTHNGMPRTSRSRLKEIMSAFAIACHNADVTERWDLVCDAAALMGIELYRSVFLRRHAGAALQTMDTMLGELGATYGLGATDALQNCLLEGIREENTELVSQLLKENTGRNSSWFRRAVIWVTSLMRRVGN